MDNHELDSRKMLILKAIIDDYIESKEPVGSRTIAKKYDMGLSSATIRNEMADLEEMGYLSQPHTSAGRIPSEKGYRLYVDRLMNLKEQGIEPTAEELGDIKSHMQHKISELSEQMRMASEIVSRLTDYTAIVVSGSSRRSMKIKALQTVPVEMGKALILIVLDDDTVKNSIVSVDSSITAEMLMRISVQCNLLFSGHRVEDINMDMIDTVAESTGVPRILLYPIVEGIVACIRKAENTEVHTEGASRLLAHPEFNDIGKARNVLELLNREDLLVDMIQDCSSAGGLVVRIGSENKIQDLNDCSVVTASYSVNGVELGTIGVLGPTRMDYSKVISALEYVRKGLQEGLGDKQEMAD